LLWDAGAWAIAALSGYVLGSIPTAYAAGRLKGLDIQKLGDRNAGAANVYRSIGPRAGVLVAVVDIAKGAAAVLLAGQLSDSDSTLMIAGFAVVGGHIRPLLPRQPGGRGAATAVGVLLATYPLLALPLGLACLGILAVSRKPIIPLGTFLIGVPLMTWWPGGYDYPFVAYSVAIPLLVGLAHFFSVRRLAQLEPGSGPAVSSR
jgi:glycerol-3-phosphate acyltransferase PlsY